MTREEAINVLNMVEAHGSIVIEAKKMAIEALSTEPCEDTISFPKGTLKKRGKGYVVYNPEWLKENWQTELKVMGVECEDAISRQAVLTYIEFILTHGMGKKMSFEFIKKFVEKLPSFTPKPKMGRWIRISPAGIYECSECGQNVMTGDIDAYRHCHGCGVKMEEIRR